MSKLGGAALLVALLCLLSPPAAPQVEPDKEEPPPIPATSTLQLDTKELLLSVLLTPQGPLFALQPLADSLGVEVEPGAYGMSYRLRVDEREYVFGPKSAAVTLGQEIMTLSQPVRVGAAGPMVPVDFLQHTLGVLGYRFGWNPQERRLSVGRRQRRTLPVLVDPVHLQGMTTVVFQFDEPPSFEIRRDTGTVEVEIFEDRLRALPYRLPDESLIEDLAISSQYIRLRLAPGTVADSYTLDDPFRLVFDIHPGGAPATPEAGLAYRPASRDESIRTIALDPGHGGSETGALGRTGVAEKQLTLQLAQTLKRQLEQRLPVRVVLTRNEDAELPLETRTAIANQNKADLFVSLHLNSSPGSRAHGAETYFLSLQASDELAAQAAAAENMSDGGSGDADPLYELQFILWDLAQSHYLAESQRLANLIQQELNQALGLRDRGVRQAPFRVLMGAAMPAVLVELGFLSNPEEEDRLQNPTYRAELVEALVRAISRYKAQVEYAPVTADSVR